VPPSPSKPIVVGSSVPPPSRSSAAPPTPVKPVLPDLDDFDDLDDDHNTGPVDINMAELEDEFKEFE